MNQGPKKPCCVAFLCPECTFREVGRGRPGRRSHHKQLLNPHFSGSDSELPDSQLPTWPPASEGQPQFSPHCPSPAGLGSAGTRHPYSGRTGDLGVGLTPPPPHLLHSCISHFHQPSPPLAWGILGPLVNCCPIHIPHCGQIRSCLCICPPQTFPELPLLLGKRPKSSAWLTRWLRGCP